LSGRWRRALLIGLAVLVPVVALSAMPVRGYLAQRSDMADDRARLDEVQRENAELEARLAALDDPELIERIARRDYGLVREGEESYAILPPPSAGLIMPNGWPFGLLEGPVTAAAAAQP
jgi:cell division protein FtsB